MVSYADAIVHPLTMVVKALHALVAYVAVTRVSRTYHFAVRTEKIGFKLLDQTNKWDVGRAPHIARLSFDSEDKENHCTHKYHEQDGEPAVSVNVCIKILR